MTLDDLLEEIQDITGRPDIKAAGIIRSRISQAILKCHAVAEFRRDIVLVNPDEDFAPSNSGKVTFPLPPRFRKLITPIAFYADGTKVMTFEEASSEAPLTNYYGFLKPFTWFVLGNNLHINYLHLPTHFHLEYLAFPEIDWQSTPATSTSFLLDVYPDIIINYASAKVFAAFGDTDQRDLALGDFAENRAEIIRMFEQV
jgi:hypothetical protein